MARSEHASAIKTQFEGLLKHAVLDILLPRSPGFDACGALKKGSLEELSRLPSRRNLFFDERATITLILRTEQTEDTVRALLPPLELGLAVHATEAVPQGSGNAASASGKHDLTTKTIPASEYAGIVAKDNETLVVWTPAVELPRPRVRLQRPAVYFTAHLAVRTETLASSRADGKVYLERFESMPANVLESLQFMPSLAQTKVFLPETRITKVAPSTASLHDDMKPLRSASRRAFPIVPALFTKLRYSALPDSVVASLHLETSRIAGGTVLIKDLALTTLDAQIECLNPPELPLSTAPGDESVLLFRLRAPNAKASPASISVHLEAVVRPDDSHSPDIELDVHWTAQVDLSQTFVTPTYKWSRPISSSSIRPAPRPSIHNDSKAGALDAVTREEQHPATADANGVTFNIWTPSVVPSRINFKLHVQCINHSDRKRRFAIVVVEPKKRSMKIEALAAPSSSSSAALVPDRIAETYATAELQTQRPPHVFDINPDVRMGPLPPGACYETELKFWATTTGVLELGVVRIVDLDTRQMIDVRELPDVVVLDPSSEE